MVSRYAILLALILIEASVAGEAFLAMRRAPAHPQRPAGDVVRVPSPVLIEGGPHRVFSVDAHPTLTVNIGYADLTIETTPTTQVDVSVSKGDDGFYRPNAPIAARADKDAILVETTGSRPWPTMGDDRRVTIVVPPGTTVDVAGAGDIDALGLHAPALLTSTGSGTVTVRDYVASALHVTSGRGGIELDTVAVDRLYAQTTDGPVHGTALDVRDGSIDAPNGDVTLGFGRRSDTLVTAASANGSISVAGFDASSPQAIRIGRGSGRLDVRSRTGTIAIRTGG